jgi:hypothetical protein
MTQKKEGNLSWSSNDESIALDLEPIPPGHHVTKHSVLNHEVDGKPILSLDTGTSIKTIKGNHPGLDNELALLPPIVPGSADSMGQSSKVLFHEESSFIAVKRCKKAKARANFEGFYLGADMELLMDVVEVSGSDTANYAAQKTNEISGTIRLAPPTSTTAQAQPRILIADRPIVLIEPIFNGQGWKSLYFLKKYCGSNII